MCKCHFAFYFLSEALCYNRKSQIDLFSLQYFKTPSAAAAATSHACRGARVVALLKNATVDTNGFDVHCVLCSADDLPRISFFSSFVPVMRNPTPCDGVVKTGYRKGGALSDVTTGNTSVSISVSMKCGCIIRKSPFYIWGSYCRGTCCITFIIFSHLI